MRKKFISKLLVLAMSVSLFSSVPQPVLAEGPTEDSATISGTLLDKDGKPVKGKNVATVTVRDRGAQGTELQTINVNEDGTYTATVTKGHSYQIIGLPYQFNSAQQRPQTEAVSTNVCAVTQVVTADDAQITQDLQIPNPITVPNGEMNQTFSAENDWALDILSGAGPKWTNRGGDVHCLPGGFNSWNSNPNSFDLHQQLSDMEEGIYTLQISVRADMAENDEAYLYVKNAEQKILVKEDIRPTNNNFEVYGLTIEVTGEPITIGVYGNCSGGKLVQVDDVRMGKLPEPEETFSKAQLKTLLDKAGTYNAEDYVASSFTTLTEAKTSAQAVHDNESATDKEITAAYKALQAAIDGLVPAKKAGDAKYQNDIFWYDTDGNVIYSQGGGIFKFDNKYYWYGVKYEEAEKYAKDPTTGPYSTNPSPKFLGVTCYSSDDLATWTYEGLVVTREEVSGKEEMNNQEVAWVGRLGVAKVDGKYALLVQHECPDEDNSLDGNIDTDNFSKQVLVLTSDTPDGEFKWNQRINMNSYTGGTSNTGDQTVFTDDDGTSYLVYSYGSGRGKMFLSKIVAQENDKIGLAQSHMVYQGAGREGNCMFKYNNKYYMCASDLYGWNASHAYYMVLDSLEDSYLESDTFKPATSMQLMDGSSEDFCHVTQTGFFYTVKGSDQETVIFCGDRWSDFAKNGLGYNQWCPLSFKADGTPYFNSLSAWDLDLATGKWTVHATNNYAKNGSFDADRVNQKELAGWTNTINEGNAPINNDKSVVTGKYALKLGDAVDFDCKVSQEIAQNTATADAVQLPNGTYDLKAKLKNTGTFDELSMYVKSGNITKKTLIKTAHANYTEITLPDVAVTGNKAEIGFIAKGKANASALIDDVSFVLAKEQEVSSGKISCDITSDTTKKATITATNAGASIVYVYEAELANGKNTYTLEPIAAGSYAVDIDVHACNITGGSQNVTVTAGQTTATSAVTVTNQGGNVTGKIVDDSGEAVVGAVVSLVQDGKEPVSVKTAADGTYTINDVMAGTYTVQAVKEGYGEPETKTVEVTVGETATVADLVMEKQVGTISGKVYDQSGAPVGGATVKVRGNKDMNDDKRFQTQTGEDGSYTIDVIAGSYQVLTEQADAGVQAVSETLTVEAKQSYTADLRLPKSVNLPNGDFENAFSSSDWTITGTGAKQTNRKQDVLNGNGGLNIWTGSDYAFELSQTLNNVRNGKYIINLKAESGDFGAEDVLYFYAKNKAGEFLGKENIPNVKITKGEVLGLVVEVTDKTLTVGISGDMTGGAWSHVDDFCVGRIVPLDADSVAAENVMDLIDAIGTVKLTDACKKKINDAKTAFGALNEAQKALVDNADILTKADEKYQELEQKQEEQNADQRAADKVIDLINSIGTVDASADSKAKIDAARAAYEQLSPTQKELVKNLNVLTQAETKYEEVSKPSVPAKVDINKAAVAAIAAQTYTGKNITPAVKVTYGKETLVKDKDYTVSYSNNKNIGTAKVTITGKGIYEKSVTKNFTITVKKNKVYTVGSYKYKITNAKTNGKGTVAVSGGKSKNLKKVNIGATVKIGGKSFKITSIAKGAFKGYKKLTSVTIGKNVTKIENSAFEKCAKVKTIKISGTGLKSVGKNAIKGINKKATIKCPKKKLAKYKKLFKSSTGYKKTMKIKK